MIVKGRRGYAIFSRFHLASKLLSMVQKSCAEVGEVLSPPGTL